jgi:hypothetical protein
MLHCVLEHSMMKLRISRGRTVKTITLGVREGPCGKKGKLQARARDSPEAHRTFSSSRHTRFSNNPDHLTTTVRKYSSHFKA